MKNILPPILAYLMVCIIVILIPASEGYNTVGWKLFVGQIYAIPLLILASLITFFVKQRRIQFRN